MAHENRCTFDGLHFLGTLGNSRYNTGLQSRLMKELCWLDSQLSNFLCGLDDSWYIADRLWRRVFQLSDLSAFDGRVLAYTGSDG